MTRNYKKRCVDTLRKSPVLYIGGDVCIDAITFSDASIEYQISWHDKLVSCQRGIFSAVGFALKLVKSLSPSFYADII